MLPLGTVRLGATVPGPSAKVSKARPAQAATALRATTTWAANVQQQLLRCSSVPSISPPTSRLTFTHPITRLLSTPYMAPALVAATGPSVVNPGWALCRTARPRLGAPTPTLTPSPPWHAIAIGASHRLLGMPTHLILPVTQRAAPLPLRKCTLRPHLIGVGCLPACLPFCPSVRLSVCVRCCQATSVPIRSVPPPEAASGARACC